MTRTPHFDGDIGNEDEFETALGELLSAAAESDVDPRGSWLYRGGGAAGDWEVMIIELKAASD